jgi:hypothetical protein
VSQAVTERGPAATYIHTYSISGLSADSVTLKVMAASKLATLPDVGVSYASKRKVKHYTTLFYTVYLFISENV